MFLVLWEIGSLSKVWIKWEAFEWLRNLLVAFGFKPIYLPWIGAVPAPTEVLAVWVRVLADPGLLAKLVHELLPRDERDSSPRCSSASRSACCSPSAAPRSAWAFPVFEVLRPIPPLAWVPASILFWPTQEMSIAFVTFLGAFFTIVINVVGGARSIDVRYFQAARSMGSSQSDIFWRIILPGTLPSIMVGSAVGMGITWEVVVAAEMISGGGSQIGGTSGGGLGFFIWNSYVGGSYEQIVVGMISIGIAGFISSELLRALGRRVTPWLRLR